MTSKNLGENADDSLEVVYRLAILGDRKNPESLPISVNIDLLANAIARPKRQSFLV